MRPIEELQKHLFNRNFRNVLDEHGKPVPPKSYVYNKTSVLMNNALSPRCMYTILPTNRYGVHDALLTHYDIQKPDNITASSIDDDGSFDQSISNTEINCLIKIPLKIWHDIDCEKVIYKSRKKVQRNYSTLRRERWTNEVFALIQQETKLPCTFTFKRYTISETGIYVTVNGSCPDCKATMIATVANKPPSDIKHVRMECNINRFNPSVKQIKKRPLDGAKQAKISESLVTGTLSAATWRRKVADDLMELYDDEPPHIYTAATLRKAKQEKRDKNLKVKETCAFFSLQNMKYSDYAGSIHGIDCDPFFIHYWTSEQIAVYINHHDVLHIDGTGSSVKKLLLPNGEQSPHIYLYQAVAEAPTHKMPIFQMLSASQNVNAIKYWILEFLRVGEEHESGFPIPRTIVCDIDKALLNAIAKAFRQSASLKNYLSTCYAALLNEPGIKLPKCFIRLDVCHYMHFLSHRKGFSELHPKVKKFYLYAMALLTKQTIFIEFGDLVKHIVILSLSEDVGKNDQGREIQAQRARAVITGKIKGISDMDKSIEELKNKTDVIEQDISLDDCSVVVCAHNIVDECRRTVKSSVAGDEINPYYVPELGNILKNLLYCFPLFTGIMIPLFGYGGVNISSATVESEMKDVKHVLLKNDASQSESR